jgi:hypothetical protein
VDVPLLNEFMYKKSNDRPKNGRVKASNSNNLSRDELSSYSGTHKKASINSGITNMATGYGGVGMAGQHGNGGY